jgi:hypothetical protein
MRSLSITMFEKFLDYSLERFRNYKNHSRHQFYSPSSCAQTVVARFIIFFVFLKALSGWKTHPQHHYQTREPLTLPLPLPLCLYLTLRSWSLTSARQGFPKKPWFLNKLVPRKESVAQFASLGTGSVSNPYQLDPCVLLRNPDSVPD